MRPLGPSRFAAKRESSAKRKSLARMIRAARRAMGRDCSRRYGVWGWKMFEGYSLDASEELVIDKSAKS